MTKRVNKKIIALIIVIAAVVCLIAGIRVVQSGYFKPSNYSRLDLDKYVTLGEYKGLEFTKEESVVTDKDVQDYIASEVAASSETASVTEGTVASGDTVNISYVGKIDGKEFSGGSASGVSIKLGEGKLIPGFEEGIVGKKIGSTFDLNLAFPADYHVDELKGKKVVFTVTLNAKEITKTPEYNDDWVKNNTEYETTKEYEAVVKARMLDQADESNTAAVKTELWDKIMEGSEVSEYPEKQLAYEKERAEADYKSMAEMYGMEWKDFKAAMFKDDEEYDKDITEYGQAVCKQKLVLYALAEKEGVSVSSSEFKDYLDGLLENAGMTKAEFEEAYGMSIEKYARENELKTNVIYDKVMDKVMEYGKNTADSSADSSKDAE